jgi:hypothetical protein
VILKLKTGFHQLNITLNLDRRIRAYNEVIRLSRNGGSPAQISRKTGLADATIRGWRGLADSDGCPAVTTTKKRKKPWFFVQMVVATSTSIPLLSYTRAILNECFRIKATLVYKGNPHPRPYKNVMFHSTKRVFDLRISRFDEIKRFSQIIGFGLSRKQENLDSAIEVRDNFGSGEDAVEEWTRNWEHGKTEWIRKKGVS